MFGFSVSMDMSKNPFKKNDDKRIPTYLLAYLLTLFVKELKISHDIVINISIYTHVYIITHHDLVINIRPTGSHSLYMHYLLFYFMSNGIHG